MKKMHYLSLIGIICLFAACQDQEPAELNTKPTIEDYFPLQIGNQWIYDRHEFLDGQERLQTTDTLRVSSVRQIDGEQFFELQASSRTLELFFPKFIRRNGESLVDDENKVWLVPEETPEIFQRDSFFRGDPLQVYVVMNKQMVPMRKEIAVPAGDFSCLDVGTTIVSLEPDYPFGERVSHEYYAEEVGVIQKNLYYYSADASIEIRLQDFQLE